MINKKQFENYCRNCVITPLPKVILSNFFSRSDFHCVVLTVLHAPNVINMCSSQLIHKCINYYKHHPVPTPGNARVWIHYDLNRYLEYLTQYSSKEIVKFHSLLIIILYHTSLVLQNNETLVLFYKHGLFLIEQESVFILEKVYFHQNEKITCWFEINFNKKIVQV